MLNRKNRFSTSPENKENAFKLFAELLESGLTIREAAEETNDRLGLDFEKSTYHKAYKRAQASLEAEEEIYLEEIQEEVEPSETPNIVFDEERFESRLDMLARARLNLIEQRKMIVRERALLEEQIRDSSDKKAVADAIVRIWNKKAEPMLPKHISVNPGKNKIRIVGYGDVHWDYTIDNGTLYYNKKVAASRLDELFGHIDYLITSENLKEIYLADVADDIEGTALRASQLLRITESMTEQAKGYSKYLVEKIRWLAERHPNVQICFLHVSEDNHSQLRLHNTNRDELPENLQQLITSEIETFVNTAHSFDKLNNLTYIAAPEIVLSLGYINIVFAHGHQYSKNDNILEMASKRHEIKVHAFIAGHWHQYSHKNKDVYQGIQESLIFLPAVVGDTDYSERLFLSSRPGFAKITVDLDEMYITSEQVLFKRK